MEARTREVVRALAAAYEARSPERALALFRPEARLWRPLAGEAPAREALPRLLAAAPAGRVELRTLVADGDAAVVELAAGGRERTEVYRLYDGAIASCRVYADAPPARRLDADSGASAAGTRAVAYALYAAYLAGDGEAMLALMADDVEVRFLGQGAFHGLDEVRRFMEFAAGLLADLDFRIERILVDGDAAAAIWQETATVAASGAPWRNHGVDVLRVRDGRIVSVHENNDVSLVLRHFPPYERHS